MTELEQERKRLQQERRNMWDAEEVQLPSMENIRHFVSESAVAIGNFISGLLAAGAWMALNTL
jgi:hypothetical protein